MPTEEQTEAFRRKCESLTDEDWDFIKQSIEQDLPGCLDIPHFRMETLLEVHRERERQDAKWGGPGHDALHTREDWELFIHDRLSMASLARDDTGYRRRILQAAALALAAIEEHDRKMASRAGCSLCGQSDHGQTGEYPCAKCGLPATHDE